MSWTALDHLDLKITFADVQDPFKQLVKAIWPNEREDTAFMISSKILHVQKPPHPIIFRVEGFLQFSLRIRVKSTV